MVTLDDNLNRFPLPQSSSSSCRTFDEFFFDESDDNDSALLMDDGQFELISPSSLSDDENLFLSTKNSSDQIEEYFQTKNKEKLIDFAKSFGLFDIRYRKQIWPLLIDSPSYAPIEYQHQTKLFRPINDFYAAGRFQFCF